MPAPPRIASRFGLDLFLIVFHLFQFGPGSLYERGLLVNGVLQMFDDLPRTYYLPQHLFRHDLHPLSPQSVDLASMAVNFRRAIPIVIWRQA